MLINAKCNSVKSLGDDYGERGDNQSWPSHLFKVCWYKRVRGTHIASITFGQIIQLSWLCVATLLCAKKRPRPWKQQQYTGARSSPLPAVGGSPARSSDPLPSWMKSVSLCNLVCCTTAPLPSCMCMQAGIQYCDVHIRG